MGLDHVLDRGVLVEVPGHIGVIEGEQGHRRGVDYQQHLQLLVVGGASVRVGFGAGLTYGAQAIRW